MNEFIALILEEDMYTCAELFVFHQLSVLPDYIFLSNYLMFPKDMIPELLNAVTYIIANQALHYSWEMHIL